MSIASEITRLQSAKSTLKTKLNAKNDAQHQIDDETLDEYGDFVDSIPSGGGSSNRVVTGTFTFATTTVGTDVYSVNGDFTNPCMIEVYCDSDELITAMANEASTTIGIEAMTVALGDYSNVSGGVRSPKTPIGTSTRNTSGAARTASGTSGRGPRCIDTQLNIGSGAVSSGPAYIKGVTYTYKVYCADFS